MFNGVIYQPGDYIFIYYNVDLKAIWDGSQFLYEDSGNDEVIITGYGVEYSNIIAIPDTIKGKTVTAISDRAFFSKYISTVNLTENLKQIGIRAFASNYLTKISIPDSVEFIGVGAFQDNYLDNVVLGSGLKTIEPLTFRSNNLQEIILPENITSIGEGAFHSNNIDYIIIGADVDIKSDNAMGTYGASFKAFYDANGKQAGSYFYNDEDDNITWIRY